MVDKDGFGNWLKKNTTYTDKVVGNVKSRMVRVDKIVEWNDSPDYLLRLAKEDEFIKASVNIRSQLRRAAKLYSDYKGISLL